MNIQKNGDHAPLISYTTTHKCFQGVCNPIQVYMPTNTSVTVSAHLVRGKCFYHPHYHQ